MTVIDPISVANNLRQALAMLLIARSTASGIIEIESSEHSGSIKVDKGDLVGVTIDHPEASWDGQAMLSALLDLTEAKFGFLELEQDDVAFASMQKLQVPLITVISSGDRKAEPAPRPKPSADLALWFGQDKLFDEGLLGGPSMNDLIHVFNTGYEADVLEAIAEPVASRHQAEEDPLAFLKPTSSAALAVEPLEKEIESESASASAAAETKLESKRISEKAKAAEADSKRTVEKSEASKEKKNSDIVSPSDTDFSPRAAWKEAEEERLKEKSEAALCEASAEEREEFLSVDPNFVLVEKRDAPENLSEKLAAESQSDPFEDIPEPDYESLRRNTSEVPIVEATPAEYGKAVASILDESELAALKELKNSAALKAVAQTAAEKDEAEAEDAEQMSSKARFSLRRADESNLARFGKTIGVSLALVIAIGILVLPAIFMRRQTAEQTAIQLANNPPPAQSSQSASSVGGAESSSPSSSSKASSQSPRQEQSHQSQPSSSQGSSDLSSSSSNQSRAAGDQYYPGNPNPTGTSNPHGRIRYLPGTAKYEQQQKEDNKLNTAFAAFEETVFAADSYGIDTRKYRSDLAVLKANSISGLNADETVLKVQMMIEQLSRLISAKRFERDQRQIATKSQTGLQVYEVRTGPSFSGQKVRLENAIDEARKRGIDTSKYSDALKNIKQDINYREHNRELANKMQGLVGELIDKLNDKEKAVESEFAQKEQMRKFEKRGANKSLAPQATPGTSAALPQSNDPAAVPCNPGSPFNPAQTNPAQTNPAQTGANNMPAAR